MKTEIPKEDGWYWIKRPCMIATIAKFDTNEHGWLLVVWCPKSLVSFEIHTTHETLEGATFKRIEVPR